MWPVRGDRRNPERREHTASWLDILQTPSPVIVYGASALALFLLLFVLPMTPLLIDGDQAINLHGAARMVAGEAMYRDFFQYTLPGTELLYAAVMKLVGVRAWIPNATLLAVGVAMMWLARVISRRMLSSAAALLPGLLYIALAYRQTLDATHHKFSILFAMAALAVLIKNRSLGRLLLAGMFCGLATGFTQTRVLVLPAFCLFVAWEGHVRRFGWRRMLVAQAALILPFLAVLAAMSVHFIASVGPARFFDLAVVFPLRYYRGDTEFNTWAGYLRFVPQLTGWASLITLAAWVFLHVIVPFIYAAFAVVCLRRTSKMRSWRELEPWAAPLLVAMVGLALFGSIAFAPIWPRIYEVSLPALILTMWFADRSTGIWPATMRLVPVGALALMLGASVRAQTRWYGVLETAVCRIAVADRNYFDELRWVHEHSSAAEYVFDPGDSCMYVGLGVRNPTPVPFLTPTDYTRPEQVDEVVRGLERRRVRLVTWPRYWPLDAHDGLPADDHLGPLRAYLGTHYRLMKTLPERFVLQRKPA